MKYLIMFSIVFILSSCIQVQVVGSKTPGDSTIVPSLPIDTTSIVDTISTTPPVNPIDTGSIVVPLPPTNTLDSNEVPYYYQIPKVTGDSWFVASWGGFR